MINVKNIKRYDDMPFGEYLKLPHTSFSSLKKNPVLQETEGMRIGKLVHTYLITPKHYTWQASTTVVPIAKELIRFVHPLMTPEMPCTCDLECDGIILPFRGVADLPLFGQLVIDIKILGGSLDAYMKHFGYIEQVRGYMHLWDAPIGIIAAYNKEKKRVETCSFKQNTTWWEQQIKSLGTIKKQ